MGWTTQNKGMKLFYKGEGGARCIPYTHTHNTVGQPQSGLVTRVKQG